MSTGILQGFDAMPRRRADLVLVERGLFEAATILAEAPHPWVSRGGVKLAATLDAFAIEPAGLVCLDLGASTGGFTQALLSRGAARVYAADVGRGQLHPEVAGDPRVVSLESTDARRLDATLIPEPIDLLVEDVSFISLKLVLPPALPLLRPAATLIALVKPQFVAGPAHVRKGIVRDAAVHQAVCDDIAAFVTSLGFTIIGVVPSPITGGDGNREFLLGARRG
jgi:23S rRNA (cytidine1920-2'-O)/16S rRNA (cytidine1409-2'-O)-methyltransferase